MKQLAETSLNFWATSHEIQPRSSQNKVRSAPGNLKVLILGFVLCTFTGV